MGVITTKIVDKDAAGGGTGSLASPYTFTEMRSLINGGSAGAFANYEFLLNPGTFTLSATGTLTNGGSSSGVCTIKARYPGQTTLLAATGAATTRFQFFQLTSGSNASYLTWDGLVFDGNFAAGGTANLGVQTTASANLHHLTIQNCTFTGLQGNPVEFASCDYVRFIRNTVFACGKRQTGSDAPSSTSSGCTINAKSAPFAFDAYQGFHNIIAYNIIAGQVGPTTDGNGIILDNGGASTGGNDGNGTYTIQNTLVIRNIVYGCGGRGFHNLRCAAPQGHWFINNLSFKNCLDKSMSFTTSGFGSEYDVFIGGPTYFVNNVAVPWTGTSNYGSTAFRESASTILKPSNYVLFDNLKVTGGKNDNPMTATAGQVDTITSPGFIAAPSYNPDTIGDPYLVPDPRTLGPAFDVLSTSVLRNVAIDPRSLAQMTAQMQADATPYLIIDLAGRQAAF
jgi:hypothetical protein